ncbi:tail protein X [Kiloniella litopenaei]|uniref:tail protein X n=1 Tax=Kiloniella litopenaei TaxID=1549748 RepID=UPI003BA9DCB7
MAKYITKDKDMIDAICFKYYGFHQGTVELVLEANPGLAKQPSILPVGLVIELPDIERKETPKTVRFWD